MVYFVEPSSDGSLKMCSNSFPFIDIQMILLFLYRSKKYSHAEKHFSNVDSLCKSWNIVHHVSINSTACMEPFESSVPSTMVPAHNEN